MRKLIIFTGLLLTLALIFTTGCERKVINELAENLANDATPCFTCHSDQNFALVSAEEQWKDSKHASGENIDRNHYNSSFYGACEQCHTSEGFLRVVAGEEVESEHFTAIGCFTCHQPHSKGSLELRVTSAATLLNSAVYDKGSSNTCAPCHQSRVNVDTYVVDNASLSLRWGPHHSNHSDMLLGTNAYEYANYEYDNSPHTNVTIDGCVDCHMSASGDYTLGGHSFGMYDEEKDHENKTGCNTSNCHDGDVDEFDLAADDDFDWDGTEEGVQAEVQGLLDSLEHILETAGLLEDEHPLSVTVATADSAGAVFNWLFVHEDRSLGIHNTEYAVGLLQSSINYMIHGDPEGAPQGVAFLNKQ